MSLQIKLGQDPEKPSSVLAMTSTNKCGKLNATAFEGKDEAVPNREMPPLANAIAFRPEGE